MTDNEYMTNTAATTTALTARIDRTIESMTNIGWTHEETVMISDTFASVRFVAGHGGNGLNTRRMGVMFSVGRSGRTRFCGSHVIPMLSKMSKQKNMADARIAALTWAPSDQNFTLKTVSFN